MKSITLLLFCLFNLSFGTKIYKFFEKINKIELIYKQNASEIAWESSINPRNITLAESAANLQRRRLKYLEVLCAKLVTLDLNYMLNSTQKRQMYLLCREPVFTFFEIRTASALLQQLQSIYSDAEICIQTPEPVTNLTESAFEEAIFNYLKSVKDLLPSKLKDSVPLAAKIAASERAFKLMEQTGILCLIGEEDVQRMMKYSNREEVLKWLWLAWREKVGPPMRKPYSKLAVIENIAARRSGLTDIGASWRSELEIPDLRRLCRRLYEDIKPLYTLLHGVTRFYLRKLKYGHLIKERGALPAHLFGNLWAQNWEKAAPLIYTRSLDIDKAIKSANWSVSHMLKRAEDFYQSLGLPPMTETFWRKSVFKRNGKTRCHGTAADMFRHGDFRLLYCSGTTVADFYVIHHEMGHIQYYMAYENQPAVFRGANSALHEAIGDTIMLGVLTPQHLHRLGLIGDSVLYSALDDLLEEVLLNDSDINSFKMNTDEILLLQHALAKIPQIPFALLIEEYRWRYFEGSLKDESLNQEFWALARELQGIEPPDQAVRGEEYFDIGAQFHVPDNTPYVRYFLSYFLQYQLFESLCKVTVFGRKGVRNELPPRITLNRCDIYGSKPAGNLLKDIMTRGNSEPWNKILNATIGYNDVSAGALKTYYRPLQQILEDMVMKYNIPIGWEKAVA